MPIQAHLHMDNYQLQNQPLYHNFNQLNQQNLQSQSNFMPIQTHSKNSNNKKSF